MQGSRLCFLILPTIYNVFICSFLLYIQLTQLWYNQSVHKKDSSKWKIISVLTNLADIIYRTAQDNVRVPCTREFAYMRLAKTSIGNRFWHFFQRAPVSEASCNNNTWAKRKFGLLLPLTYWKFCRQILSTLVIPCKLQVATNVMISREQVKCILRNSMSCILKD